jgi:hypothetical protein
MLSSGPGVFGATAGGAGAGSVTGAGAFRGVAAQPASRTACNNETTTKQGSKRRIGDSGKGTAAAWMR